MIPPKTDKRWEDLITGVTVFEFKSVPLGMMISRHKRELQKNKTKETAAKLINESYDFFIKFEKILQDDIKSIFG